MARRYLETVELAILGSLEQHGETFGRQLLQDVEARVGRTVGIGGLHVVLERLIAHAYIESRYGEPSTHGGPRRRFYRITSSGKAARRGGLEAINRAASIAR